MERCNYNLLFNCKSIAHKSIYGNPVYDYAEKVGDEYLYKCGDGRYFLKCYSANPYAAMSEDYPHVYKLTKDEAREWVDEGIGTTEISNENLLDLFPELKDKLKLGVETE